MLHAFHLISPLYSSSVFLSCFLACPEGYGPGRPLFQKSMVMASSYPYFYRWVKIRMNDPITYHFCLFISLDSHFIKDYELGFQSTCFLNPSLKGKNYRCVQTSWSSLSKHHKHKSFPPIDSNNHFYCVLNSFFPSTRGIFIKWLKL